MPQTQSDGRHITEKLSQAIREMRDFLLGNPMTTNLSDTEKYKNIYIQISKLSIETLAEGYVGYEHDNPHKTLAEFLNTNEPSKCIIKYYKEPNFKKYISLSDSIKVSDEVFVKIIDDIQWGASELALIGIIFTLVVGLAPLLNIFLDNFWISFSLAFGATVLLLVLLTKVKLIKRQVISFFRWLLK